MNVPDIHRPFARTNIQTIRQRSILLRELHPGITSVAEICCGDCQQQYLTYRTEMGIQRFNSLDLSLDIMAFNCSRNIPCVHGNALDGTVMRSFLDFDAIFFGPPLSENCDGHHLFSFREVNPGFLPFIQLMVQELNYQGILILIGPRTTTLGDVQWIDHLVKNIRSDYSLRLLHYSHSSVTGSGEEMEMRLKYVELWYQVGASQQWEIRESRG
jgi:hypothetical protein